MAAHWQAAVRRFDLTMQTWLIRFLFIVLCSLLAWGIWLVSQVGLQWPSDWRLFNGSEAAAVFGLAAVVFGASQGFFRWLAVPNLRVEIHQASPQATSPYAFHHVEVWNEERPWFLRPLFLVTAPEGCQIKFQYWRESGGSYVRELCSEWLPGRWNENPQPLVQTGVGVVPNQEAATANRRLPKLFPTERKLPAERKLPDPDPYIVAFAIKRQGDSGFYHFNDMSYLHPGWCDPKWCMPEGVYKVKILITGYGMVGAKRATITLQNSGTQLSGFTIDRR